MSTLNARIQLKHDTDANWATVGASFVPLAGEFIFYETSKKFKVGDGVTAVGSLDFLNEDELPAVVVADNGKILKVVNGVWAVANETTELPAVSGSDAGKILKVDANGEWVKGDETAELPSVSGSDNGKVLKVINGAWAAGDQASGVSSYDDLEDTPMYLYAPEFDSSDAIGSGTWMGQSIPKVSNDFFDTSTMDKVTVDNTVYTGNKIMDWTDTMTAIVGTEIHVTCVSTSGRFDASGITDIIVISLDQACTVPAYGIALTAGTYMVGVQTMQLAPVVVINEDYAQNLLPNVSTAEEGKTIEVVDGKWAVGSKHSVAGVEDWSRIQRMLRGGNGTIKFPIWSQIRVPHKEYGTIVFDVIDHDKDKDPNDSSRHTMTLLMRDALPGMQFDATEALCVCSSGLAAGTYYFDATSAIYSDIQHEWEFTLNNAVPSGGVLVFTVNILTGLPTEINVYANISSLVSLETATVTQGNSGTDISTVIAAADLNQVDRAFYGSGNYYQSGVRQFLNSNGAAGTWWVSQTKFDRPPSYASQRNGFMAGFPAEFLAALVQTEQVTNTNQVYETDMQVSTSSNPYTYTVTDKFFLGSWTQYGGSQWSQQADENAIWAAFADSGTGNSDDRVKVNVGNRATTQWYWQRSCYPGYSCIARDVNQDGHPDLSGRAYDPTSAVAAACVIGEI